MKTAVPLIFLLLLLQATSLFIPPATVQANEQLFSATLHLAEQGDPEAQFSLGLLYDTGNQVERNPEQAAYWFTQAADGGVTGACLYLGMKYEFGTGVKQDRTRALHWYRQAALKGWGQAAFMLANLYLNNQRPDLAQGCSWLQIAADQEFPGAELARQQHCSELDKETARKIATLSNQLHRRITLSGQPAPRE